jgi:hypothetical protein
MVVVAALAAAIAVGVAHSNGAVPSKPGATPVNVTTQFAGRDIYSPDVHPDPVGGGYIMWYAGWQTQQTVNSGQLDTIYRRTAPTPDGPWSAPTTAIVAAQVAPQVSEVNDPSVSILSVNGSRQYTMFFTALVCRPGAPGCTTTAEQAINSEVWSATSSNGIQWGSFKRMTVVEAGNEGVSQPSAVLQPSGDQQWVVFYGTGCVIGMASVSADRQVLSSTVAYWGNGAQCMSNPMVSEWGSKWHMVFNVLAPTGSDAVRFDIWTVSSPSLTNWLFELASPVVVAPGGHFCGALAPDVLPAGADGFNVYFGLVTPGSSGACDDLTQSASIARTQVLASTFK